MARALGGSVDPDNFYSDASSSINKGQCTSTSNAGFTSLSQIFTALRTQFTKAKLIVNTTATGGWVTI